MSTHVETRPHASIADAYALPSRFYTAPDIFQAEMEHIHLRTWFFVGLASELSSPGEYCAIDTVGGPAILLRDEQNNLRAFANCCRHRGSLLLSGAGRIRAIRCPYHAWA
ncbi:MAG: aromatic ring-hydroxylating oxygenase subunit alpha, partial [Acetobacteraceae bacterium]